MNWREFITLPYRLRSPHANSLANSIFRHPVGVLPRSFAVGFSWKCSLKVLSIASPRIIELPDDCLGGRSAINIAFDDLLDVVLRPRQDFANHPRL